MAGVGKESTWKRTDEGKFGRRRRIWWTDDRNLRRFALDEGQATGAAAVRFACGQAMAAGLVRRATVEFRKRYPLGRADSTMRGRPGLKAFQTVHSIWRS